MKDQRVTYVGEEYFLRFGIFLRDLERVRQNNVGYHEGPSGDGGPFEYVRYTLELNRFAAYTPAEDRALLGWRPAPRWFTGASPPMITAPPVESLPTPVTPSATDLTIADQGKCGGGWAFAVVAAFELTLSPSVKLSEQQLLGCTPYTGGCRYGNVAVADDHVTRNQE